MRCTGHDNLRLYSHGFEFLTPDSFNRRSVLFFVLVDSQHPALLQAFLVSQHFQKLLSQNGWETIKNSEGIQILWGGESGNEFYLNFK